MTTKDDLDFNDIPIYSQREKDGECVLKVGPAPVREYEENNPINSCHMVRSPSDRISTVSYNSSYISLFPKHGLKHDTMNNADFDAPLFPSKGERNNCSAQFPQILKTSRRVNLSLIHI